MLFSSSEFLFLFLPGVLVVYYGLLRRTRTGQNLFLTAASLFFYAWGEPWFVLVMMASVTANWLFALWADARLKKGRPVRPAVVCALLCNLGLLFVFKYLTFTLTTINRLGGQFLVPVIALPIGISFFTFQALSYVLDVAWYREPVQRNLTGVALYISFFPQLIAGPIVKYQTVALEIRDRKENWADFSQGACRFIVGLGKKVLLANQLALVADRAFDAGGASLTAPMAWLGAVCYTLQIYYDFSGYSDMAIGLGRMFGFHFLENFRHPYAADSITAFWRRWHISLSDWFRDYLYIPLGGSRTGSRWGNVRNLFVVWLLTGIWHGADWTFLCWGLYYFLLLSIERYGGFFSSLPALPRRVYTLLAVNFGWVLFRAEGLSAAGQYLAAMFRPGGDPVALFQLRENLPVLLLACLFAVPFADWTQQRLYALRPAGKSLAPLWDGLYCLLLMAVYLAAVSYLVKGTYNPFIYFNF